jgi:hypothetical protein
MHYCVALCLFGIGPERSRTAHIRIGVKVDANSKSSRCSLLAPPAFGRPALRWMKPRTSRPVLVRDRYPGFGNCRPSSLVNGAAVGSRDLLLDGGAVG